MRKHVVATVGVLAITCGAIVVGAREKVPTDPLTAIMNKLDEILGNVNEPSVSRSWDRKLPTNDPGGPCPSSSSRFTCVLGDAAVRDNETGLVWQREPTSETREWGLAPGNARNQCLEARTGGVTGWRLPAVNELMSLVDGERIEPALPLGHPFTNVKANWGEGYWSASFYNHLPTDSAWMVGFYWGQAGTQYVAVRANYWCVRGPSTPDQY